jgi:isochorismate synthase EntC
MPGGKPAGIPCVHLTWDLRCELFGLPSRPQVCGSLQPEPAMCGADREHALGYLRSLELSTRP